jgi:hypothetical protein
LIGGLVGCSAPTQTTGEKSSHTKQPSTPSITEFPIAITPTISETLTPIIPSRTSTPTSITQSEAPVKTEITQSATFDPSRIQTATPAPSVQCPARFTGTVPTPEFVHEYSGHAYAREEEILAYLNKYGSDAFHLEYQKSGGVMWPGIINAYRDFTNDGVPELVFGSAGLYILSCNRGRYITLFETEPDAWLQSGKIIDIRDANRNGVPDISLLLGFDSQGGHSYQVIEWNGKKFQTILKFVDHYRSEDIIFVQATGNLTFEDVDHDGYSEYIVNIGIPVWETYQLGIPWREEKQIYKWNGNEFSMVKRIFSAPEYRFQAVQDGDRATQAGDYDLALTFYQDAIFSDQLEGWSPERHEFIRSVFFGSFTNQPTPIPPLPNPGEYDHLAAYSRYRIMLLHLTRGWLSDAKVVYDTLQKKYPEGTVGHIYAVLAEDVWTEFALSNDLKKACEKGLAFASENPRISFFIGGSGFPGNNGIDYGMEPEMICPFE